MSFHHDIAMTKHSILSHVANFLKAVIGTLTCFRAQCCRLQHVNCWKKVESFLSYLVDLEFLAVEVHLTLGKSFFDGEC